MKNVFILFVLIWTTCIYLSAQDTIALWPIAGKSAGENILSHPQDYIGSERNYDELIIGAPEGTPVVAPITGTINYINYGYNKSLKNSMGFNIVHAPLTDISEYDKQQRLKFAKEKHINPEFIFITISISKGKGENYYISGLRPYSYFKTGKKVNKGDTIGYVGYCYKEIPQPSICLSRSIKTFSSDPMTPFGLKSTFKPATNEPAKTSIAVTELLADFDVLREALEEGHPGLYDYTSKANMDSTFDRVRRKINNPMSASQFLSILKPITDSIRDSHTSLYNLTGQPPKYKYINVDLPVHFGFQNDSLIIGQTLPDYKKFLGKRIIRINNDSAATLLKQCNIPGTGEEGYINVTREVYLLHFFFMYGLQYNYQKGDSVTITFDDGTKALFTYQERNPNDFYPKIPNITRHPSFEITYIDSNTAYFRIYTFKLTETEQDSIREIMKTLCNSAYRNLILDIRDNPGGHNACITGLFSFFALEPFSDYRESWVKSNGKYRFFKNTSNLDPDGILFPDFKKREGKEGYYEINSNQILPNSRYHYQGNVYLLVNEKTFSAASIFTALMYKYKRGTIIGRETGTCYYQMNAFEYANVYLRNSGLEMHIPLNKLIFDFEKDTSIPWGHGVIPDHQINWTFNEFFGISDPILNYTMNLVHKTDATFLKNMNSME